MSSETPLGKRECSEETALGEPTYAAKKMRKAEDFPTSFPDPHTYQVPVPHPWEKEIDQRSIEIRCKDDWTTKVFNQEIVDKWRTETEFPFMFDRLIAELRHLAEMKTEDAEPTPADGVWMADGVIPPTVHENFTRLVREQLESQEKDYHPYSGNTVVDLVHPSLYCYIDGQSRVCEDSNHSQLRDRDQWKAFLLSGMTNNVPTLQQALELVERAQAFEVKPVPARRSRTTRRRASRRDETPPASPEVEQEDDEQVQNDPNALRFQVSLLFHEHVPEVEYVSTQADFVRNRQKSVLSDHISNIYRWIPADVRVNMMGCPEFESYINGLHPWENRELYSVIGRIMQHFLPLWARVLRDLAYDCIHKLNRIDDWNFDDCNYGLRADALNEMYQEKLDAGEDPAILNPLKDSELKEPLDFTGASLQVIVKIASIELTPKNPTYRGTWHIEGVSEERIISTGIYYFDEENIEDTYLDFRLAMGDPYCTSVQYPMGLGGGCRMHVDAGGVQTKQGRLLAFPNIMQHCVSDVTLKNKKKRGHRKMLVFFLIDPTKPGLSSSRIPPPRQDWLDKEGITLDTNSVQTLEEARTNREKLMFTRKFYVVSQNENLFERECTFCEH